MKEMMRQRARLITQRYREAGMKLPRPRKPYTSKKSFLLAMSKVGPDQTKLAKRLRITRYTVINLLKRADWEDVRRAWEQEKEKVKDLAHRTIKDAMRQRIDMPLATATAKWYLERMDKEFQTKTQVDGVIRHDHRHVHTQIPMDDLLSRMTIEEKRRLMQAIDQRDEELVEAQNRQALVDPNVIPTEDSE